jgi:menaquinone-specific isochorismate synthase
MSFYFDTQTDITEINSHCYPNGISSKYYKLSIPGVSLIPSIHFDNDDFFYLRFPEKLIEIVAFGKLKTFSVNNYHELGSFKLSFDFPPNDAKYEKLPDYFSYISFPFNSSQGIPYSSWVIPEVVIKTVGEKCLIRINSTDENYNFDLKIHELVSRLGLHTVTGTKSLPSGGVTITSVEDESIAEFSEKVVKMKSQITSGVLTKGVVSRQRVIRFEGKFDFHSAIDTLAEKYPECTILLTNYPNKLFLAATPETLFRLDGCNLVTEAVAGSIQSSEKTSEQLTRENELLHSAKNLEEHFIVRDFIVNNLKLIAREVSFDHKPVTRKLKNVTHLVSRVSARLPGNTSPVELIKLLFPTPALCGSPKLEAATIINEIEGHPRNLYGGVFGYITAGGLSEYFVSIRCGFLLDNEAVLYAGGGIVANSDPTEEFAETEIKFTPLYSLFTDELQH